MRRKNLLVHQQIPKRELQNISTVLKVILKKGVALKVEWNEPKLGEDTTFHVSADGGSGRYLFRMDAPSYSNPGEYSFESVADPSRGAWIQYTDECESHDFEFTMTASGVYNFRFYVMDKTSGVYYMRVSHKYTGI